VIRIARSTEPAALADERTKRLVAARLARSNGAALDLRGYAVAKEDLFDMQHRKCCYCEKLEETRYYRPVEHYRPKAQYCWLAWTWENLLFICWDCNSGAKAAQFPLASGSISLLAEAQPPGSEAPLLLDPTAPTPDPSDAIRFSQAVAHAAGASNARWMPLPRAGPLHALGEETIRVCGLDRPSLLDLYEEYVEHTVAPKIESFARAVSDATDVEAAFAKLLRGLLSKSRPFVGLSYDVLSIRLNPSMLAAHQLTLPRPPL